MAINFTDSPADGATQVISGRTYTYNSAKNKWDTTATEVVGPTAKTYATVNDLPGTALTGDQAFVSGTNRLYIWNGSGWYNIALINTTPTWTTQPDSSYILASDGTATTITIVATDPEGLPITYSIASDTSGNIATVSQNANVFTITPSTSDADAGTFSLTFRASDGVNIATAVSEFILVFKVANSHYTSALITSVGTNNQVNNTFVDLSTNSHTITVAGNVTQNTFSPYRHGGYSVYFDGNDALEFSNYDNQTNDFGTGDFNVECWVNFSSVSGSNKAFLSTYAGSPGGWSFFYDVANSELRFRNGDAGISGKSWSPSIGVWYHIAVSRSSSTLRFFVDGTQLGTDITNYTQDISDVDASGLQIARNKITSGGSAGSYNWFSGYISNARIIKGTALYTSNFTAPEESLTAVSGTTHLSCTLPYIKDISTNNNSFTTTTTATIEPVSPFEYLEYDAGTDGGSIYFAGSGDTLTIPGDTSYQFGTGDFTIEFWWYPRSAANPQYVLMQNFNNGNNGYSNWLFYVAPSNNLVLYSTSTGSSWNVHSGLTIGSFTLNQWHHVAITRESGTLKTFMNGNLNSTVANAADYSNSGGFRISSYDGSTSPAQQTNISNLRLVKGTAVYTADFSPPTEPLTAISGTGMLLNGTNAGIIDKSQTTGFITLNGNVESSTTQTKYLTSSMYFDGTGDYLQSPLSKELELGTSDFTVEMWARFSSIGTYIPFVSLGAGANGVSNALHTGWGVFWYNNLLYFYRYVGGSSTYSQQSWTPSTDQWYHIACSRSGTSLKTFIDGTQIGSTYTSTENYSAGTAGSQDLYVGRWGSQDPTVYFHLNGYLSDLRITKGLARYTANFTPPTAALKG